MAREKTMRELKLLAIALVIGIAIGGGQYFYATVGEENVFQVTKLVDQLPAEVVSAEGLKGKLEVLNGELHDFGSMDKGESKSHTFVLKNVGDGPLQLKLLETSCKCTLADFDFAVLQPGETKDVTLEWKSPDYVESFSQNARIQTSDADRRQLELKVMGKIVVPIRPYPEAIAMGQFQVSDGFEVSINVYAFKAESLKVVGYEWMEPGNVENLEVTSVEIPADDPVRADDPSMKSAVRVNVVGRPGLPIGPFRNALRIDTDPPAAEPIIVGVNGSGVGSYTIDTLRRVPFDASRNMIDIGTIPAARDKVIEVALVVRGAAAETVEISIDPAGISPSDHMQVTVKPKQRFGPIASFPVEIRLTGNGTSISRLGPTPDLLGKFVLKTTDPTTPTIEVYVKFALVQ